VEVSPLGVRDAGEIERGITGFADRSNGGIIVLASPLTGFHRGPIIALAAKHRLPAVYPFRYFVTGGGLVSYGADATDL
jgi:putative ABC transport system substrate-binding protein